MSLDPTAADRRIMADLDERTRIPLLNVEEGDVGILIGGPVLGLFIGSLLGGGPPLLALMTTGLLVGAAIVYAAPAHLSAWAWLLDLARYYLLKPRLTRSHATATYPASEGAPLGWTPLVTAETTADLTGIERVWATSEDAAADGSSPIHDPFGAVQRTDGVMQAFVEVRPANMDFAMSGDWATVQELGEHFVNTELDAPLTLHVTTRSFPVETMLRRIDARLDTPGVRASPVLRSLLEEYRERRPLDLAGRQHLHYYLGVEVTPLDVYTRYDHEPTPGERLAGFPILGIVLTPFITRRERFDQAELRAAMLAKLDTRLRTLEREFVEKVPGWTSTRLDAVETLGLAMSFWNGEEYPETLTLPDAPVLSRAPRADDDGHDLEAA